MNPFIAISLMLLILCLNSCCIQVLITQPDGTLDGFQYGELLGEGYRFHLIFRNNSMTFYFVDTNGDSHTIYDSHSF